MKHLLIAALAVLAFTTVAEAKPKSQMADMSHIVRLSHQDLPAACGMSGNGDLPGAYWLGCINRRTGVIALYWTLRSDQINAIIASLRANGRVVTSPNWSVIYNGPKGIADYCAQAHGTVNPNGICN